MGRSYIVDIFPYAPGYFRLKDEHGAGEAYQCYDNAERDGQPEVNLMKNSYHLFTFLLQGIRIP